jgi:hypothetical protein
MRRIVHSNPGLIGAGLLVVCSAMSTQAQISPGPLASAHEQLDTASQCFSCHGGKQRSGDIDQHCVECHSEIAWQLTNDTGLHGRERLETCSKCHPDHAGTKFDLIEWAEGSAKAFDHRRTDWPLSTPHRKLECAACHTGEFQTGHVVELMKRKQPGSSWLGLDPDCASCHEDVHRDTLGSDCNSCHAQGAWLPTRGFNHDKTRYPIDGQHANVDCVKCHPPAKQRKERLFSPLPHEQCSPCHDDVHRGGFGPDCASCHSTAGFAVLSLGNFDHSKTRFPLSGKHRVIKCPECHDLSAGSYKRQTDFESCSSCHADAHAGTARWQGLDADCGACHDDRGFRPSTLTVADHDRTAYGLEGAHRNVPCRDCHTKAPASESGWGTAGIRLQLAHETCTDCHEDAHAGQLDERADGGACESCHTVSGWKPSTFGLQEHDTLDFRLTGKHASASCGNCHGPERVDLTRLPGSSELGSARVALTSVETQCAECHFDPHEPRFSDTCDSCHVTDDFRPSSVNAETHGSFHYVLVGAHRTLPCIECHENLTRPAREIHLLRADGGAQLSFASPDQNCSSCHESPHAGQFAERESDCATCHDERNFVPAARFDHGESFPLVGEHRDVACSGCHAREASADGSEYTVYAPLSRECESCHRKGTVEVPEE